MGGSATTSFWPAIATSRHRGFVGRVASGPGRNQAPQKRAVGSSKQGGRIMSSGSRGASTTRSMPVEILWKILVVSIRRKAMFLSSGKAWWHPSTNDLLSMGSGVRATACVSKNRWLSGPEAHNREDPAAPTSTVFPHSLRIRICLSRGFGFVRKGRGTGTVVDP